MNADVNTPLTAGAPASSAAPRKPVRPFYWSLRRELWEHRSLYLAPSVVALLLLLAVLIALSAVCPDRAGFDIDLDDRGLVLLPRRAVRRTT